MTTRHLCALVVAVATSFTAVGAQAIIIGNGASLNGTSLNGISNNGISNNGSFTNGIFANGGGDNGRDLNGKSFNGLKINGTSVNGVTGADMPVVLQVEAPPPPSVTSVRLPDGTTLTIR